MESKKRENILNLALEATGEERERSIELDVGFAKEEKELFKLLFMRDRSGEQIKENPEEMEALIGLIAKQVNIDKEAARFFYLEMWAYTHGTASMIATGFYEWDEPLASRALTDVYEGLKHRYKNGGVRNDCSKWCYQVLRLGWKQN